MLYHTNYSKKNLCQCHPRNLDLPRNCLGKNFPLRGGSGISGKGVHMYEGVGVRFADFISVFLNIR